MKEVVELVSIDFPKSLNISQIKLIYSHWKQTNTNLISEFL